MKLFGGTDLCDLQVAFRKMGDNKTVLVLLTLLCFVSVLVNSISFKEDVTLTSREKDALDKFKPLVIPKIPKSSYLQNYVKDDLYFVRWLRAKRLNIRAAEEMFVNHLKWREREDIDKINNGDDGFDWVQFYKEYPAFYNGTVDKQGRPVVEVWYSEWNIRRSVIAGLTRTIHRSNQRICETLTRRIYKLRAEGKEVSQAVQILDLDGFNVFQHACPSCLPIYVYSANIMENHYPFLYDSMYFINAPSTFAIIERLVRPIVSVSADEVKIFTDRKQGLNALDKKIDKSQRSVRFGGTLIRDL